MRQWWDRLSLQEQRAVLLGAALLGLLLGYLLLWHPLMSEVSDQRETHLKRSQTLAWMELAVQEAMTLKKELSNSTRGAVRGSLLTVLEQTADTQGLRGYIQRIEPTGSDEAQVWIDRAPFDRMTTWLETLERDQAVVIKSIAVGREETQGMVNARIVVMRIGV